MVVVLQAYKLLLLLPSYRSNRFKTVLINVGSDYLLAEAFIELSLYRNLEVFITVVSDEDALLFKNRFPKVRAKNCRKFTIGSNFENIVVFCPFVIGNDDVKIL